MTDLSKRIRENLLTDPRGLDLLGGRTSLLREAAEALDQPAWRPIAEAPMDGTPVLIYSTKGVELAWRSDGVGRWLSLDGKSSRGDPTHFMPIPSPPEGE